MLNETGVRRGWSKPGRANRWWSAFLVCVVGAVATAAAAPAPEETYRWNGELVTLDDAAGMVTLKAPVVTPTGLEAMAGLDAGEPIVIKWSGFEDEADGIRTVMRDDGADLAAPAAETVESETASQDGADSEEAEPEEPQGFLLRAKFMDADGGKLTFKVAMPAESLGTVRALTRGARVTGTSVHRPARSEAPLLAVEAYSRSRASWPAPKRRATYRWRGELVTLDEATGGLTVKSWVTSPSGLTLLDGAEAGDPIVITWSGLESRASGIRSAMPDDGSGLWGSNRFLLRAAFVEMDATGRYLTFETMLPKKSLSTVRALTRGAWASAMSPHHPADGLPAVLSVDAYVAPRERERRPAPLPGASYRWDGELVSLDEATGMLTVKSRVVSPSGLAAVAGAESGDPIVINWSGYLSRASGIRAVMPDDESGLWGSNRFLLRATFSEADAENRYLTFKTRVPEDSLAAVRAMTRGSWASVRSPHHPADGVAPVLSVDAYSPTREHLPAPLPGATYRWDGELVSLDEATGTLTMKSRVVTPSGLAAVADAVSGAPIVITWSGYESHASGIRTAVPDDGSGLWGSNRFLLRATFVETDASRRYLTFKAQVPKASLGTVRALTRGSWASVRSPHHPADADSAMLSVAAYTASPEHRPAPLPGATYRWDGEFVALDEVTGALTVKSRVASPSGLAALAEARAGEPIVITWSGYDSQANGIRAAVPDDGSGLWGSNRFLLRATFVEADATGRYLTFKVAVPEASLATVRSLAQGTWASVTSPHHPADAEPAVMTVTAYAAAAVSHRVAQ